MLIGLEVEGYGLYDVTFGDGIPVELYGDIVFDLARYDEANAVSEAIAIALASLEVPKTSIPGCENTTSRCLIFNPDTRRPTGTIYSDWEYVNGVTARLASGDLHVWTTPELPQNQYWTSPTSLPDITLATYARSVHAPATLALFGIGLVGVGWMLRAKA
jgi:hypothetical protein